MNKKSFQVINYNLFLEVSKFLFETIISMSEKKTFKIVATKFVTSAFMPSVQNKPTCDKSFL